VHDFLEHVGTHGAHHVGADVPRRHRIHGNTLGGDLLRQRHRKTMDTGLGGGVVGLPELPLLAVHRTDVDDTPPLAFDHVFDNLFGNVEETVQVGIDDSTPVIQGHFTKYRVAGNAGVVHQHVDRAMLGLDLLEGCNRGVPIGDIAHRGVEHKSFVGLLLQPAIIIPVRPATGDHGKALPRKTLAYCCSDAAHAPCYICHSPTHGTSSYSERTTVCCPPLLMLTAGAA